MAMVGVLREGLSEPVSGRLAALYALYGHDLKRLAYLMTGDLGVAEDVMHDAFLRMAGRLGHLRQEDRALAYLRKTVINLVRDRGRRRDRTPLPDPPHDRDLDAEQDLRDLLMTIPARQRAALVLRYYLDLPDDEAADVLACRPATVRSLVARGLSALRINSEDDHG